LSFEILTDGKERAGLKPGAYKYNSRNSYSQRQQLQLQQQEEERRQECLRY
jgi:hypothetical protein